MTTALISDIHGNLEALDAVLAEIEARRPRRVFCLGDVVGYGASPNECLAKVRKHCELVLLGNHDAAASGGPEAARFNIYARVAADWTAKTLTRENREYLQRLPLTSSEGSGYLVHASPACPRDWEYLLDRFDAEPQFHYFNEPICFIGHTHHAFHVERHGRQVVNPGSIGQNRRRLDMACYALFDTTTRDVALEQVAYPVSVLLSEMKALDYPPECLAYYQGKL